ncbi:hypothetical protein BGX26_012254 [Mortierella sp. AD094]|nr:hypothetical protein BGX26_012254 [Mortierella sp. AD094]
MNPNRVMRHPEKRDDDDHCGWRRRNPNCTTDTALPSPTAPTAPIAPTPPTSTFTAGDSPSLTPTPVTVYNQNGRNSIDRSSSPVPLIAGICSGALIIIISAIILWCFLRRRKRRQILSQSKTILMSPQDTPQPSQFMDEQECQQQTSHSDMDYDRAEKGDHGSYKIDGPKSSPPAMSRVASPASAGGVKSSNYSSLSTPPIQSPTFPSPTPRDRRIVYISPIVEENLQPESTRMPQSASPRTNPAVALSVSTISLPHQSHHNYNNFTLQQERKEDNINIPSQRASSDFYVDMLNLVTDIQEGTSNPTKQRSVSPTTPVPTSRPNSRPNSFAPQIPTRPRSPSSASMKNPNIGETGGPTPRVSRESRRHIHNFPPPPPPPSVPPPAIPAEVMCRSGRPRASTMSSVGAQSDKIPIFPPPGVSPSQGSSEPLSRRQRSQSNAQLTDEFTEALGQLFPALPLPASLASKNFDEPLTNSQVNTAPGTSGPATRPILRQYHSHHGSTGD